jgi:DNA invertase Pin-like site-specific DNA recombinase
MRKPKPKIGCYVRVSTKDKQTTRSQRHALREWATAQRIPLDRIRWYEDKLSGAKAERPALAKMLRAVAKGSLDTVVVYRLDRLSRSTTGGLQTLATLADQQIRIVSVSQNIDFNGAMGRFLATLFLAIAEFERESIVERIKDGLAAARAEGKQLGRPRNDKRREQARKMRADGMSVVDIADELDCSRQNVYRFLAGSTTTSAA